LSIAESFNLPMSDLGILKVFNCQITLLCVFLSQLLSDRSLFQTSSYCRHHYSSGKTANTILSIRMSQLFLIARNGCEHFNQGLEHNLQELFRIFAAVTQDLVETDASFCRDPITT